MHELAIAMDVVELAEARCGDARIVKVTVAIGAGALVLPDALAFAWEAATAGTLAAGAALEIVPAAGSSVMVQSMEVE